MKDKVKEWYTIPSNLSTSTATHSSSSSSSSRSLVKSSDNKISEVRLPTSTSSESQSITIICEDCKPKDFTCSSNQLIADVLKVVIQRAEPKGEADNYCLVLSTFFNIPLPITKSLSDLHITENTHFRHMS